MNHSVRHFETPASDLVLVAELPQTAVGSKVRFRGCVSSYSHQTGTLYLTTMHPSPPTTAVDIALVRETATGPTIMTGAWVNVIGYVTSTIPPTPSTTAELQPQEGQQQHQPMMSPTIPPHSPAASSYFSAPWSPSVGGDAHAESMDDLERLGWNTAAFAYNSRTRPSASTQGSGTGIRGTGANADAEAGTGTGTTARDPRLSTGSFSTRDPRSYAPQRQASSNSVMTTNNTKPHDPWTRNSVATFNIFTSHASHASPASHASNATTRRGAVGPRDTMLDEEEYVTARVQAVVLWAADAVGEGRGKMGVGFEEGVRARRWGMGALRDARVRYARSKEGVVEGSQEGVGGEGGRKGGKY